MLKSNFLAVRDGASQLALVVKNLPGKDNVGDVSDTGSIPGSGGYPGGGNGNPLKYSSWRIPWTEEPGRLKFMGLQRAGHD